MLVLSRKRNERVVIDDKIVITVVEFGSGKVRLGIKAPKIVPIHREEVWEAIDRPERIRPRRVQPETPAMIPDKPSSTKNIARPVAASETDTISEQRMTADRLLQMLWRASLPAKKIDGDSDLLVAMEGGMHVVVNLLQGSPWLRFRKTYYLSEDAVEIDNLRTLKSLNDNGLAIRFAMPQRTTLIAEMCFPYFGGLARHQLVGGLRSFVEFLAYSLLEHGVSEVVRLTLE